MRWVTFSDAGPARPGLSAGARIVDLRALDPTLPERLEGVLALGPELPARLAACGADTHPGHVARADVRLHQPILRPGKILGIGLNYRDHAAETGREPPAVQTWFVKQATAAHAPFEPVILPAVSDMLDYEVELVVVIGQRARHVPAERAHEVIAGYTVGCDYSVRDWQRATPTMIMGKGFDTHAPFGPDLVTADELGEMNGLRLRALVNGELRQNGQVGDMIFDVGAQIAHLTKAFTLEPGDVIFTGTPAGVGVAFNPPKFVKAGDRIRVEVDRIGGFEHTIVPEVVRTVIGDHTG
jgi:2-keto-4-pentenoate hydratase/2-oxohepta-3-ene-1,7-dioic acid hydratase in catechol pathway